MIAGAQAAAILGGDPDALVRRSYALAGLSWTAWRTSSRSTRWAGPSLEVSLDSLPSRPTVMVLRPDVAERGAIATCARRRAPGGSRGMTLNPADPAFEAARAARPCPTTTLPPDRAALSRGAARPLGRAAAGWLALPRHAEEVGDRGAPANAARVGIVPYGGGTGLVGGQVMPGRPGAADPVAGADDARSAPSIPTKTC